METGNSVRHAKVNLSGRSNSQKWPNPQLKLCTHIPNECRTNICQQIWCVCRMGLLIHTWRMRANKSSQSLALNKHPLTFVQFTHIRENATECEQRHSPSLVRFCCTVHISPFYVNECVHLAYVYVA